jgi:hypothetical protein
MPFTQIRVALATLLLMAILAGTAYGAMDQTQPTPSNLGTFGSTTTATVISHKIKPLYRERTVQSHYKLHRIACAVSSGEASTTTCFAATS